MKTISAALQNFLLSTESFNRADLISITLPNGQMINAISGANVTQITYPSGLPASVTVLGTGYPWLTTDPNYPFAGSSGTSPASIAMSLGQVITLSYASGTISNGTDTFDATGGFGTVTSAYPGNSVIGAVIPPRFALIGGFANASGFLVSPPFLIGNNMTIGPAPVGTTQLLLGSNSLTYSANSGSWVISIIAPTYYATQNGTWERGAIPGRAAFKLSADTMNLTGYIPESVLYPGTTTPLMQSLTSLSGSKVVIQTLYWNIGSAPSTGFSQGTLQLTIGQIGNIKNTGRSKVTCEVFDLTYILNRPFPPHLIQSACRHSFCDSGCTLLINNFRSTAYPLDVTSTNLYLNLSIPVRANTTAYKYGNMIIVAGTAYMCTTEGTSAGSAPPFNVTRGATTVDGSVTWTSMGGLAISTPASQQAFQLGYVLFMTGQNAGLKLTIKLQALSPGNLLQLQLIKPLPFAVAAGDTVRVFTGCDKTLATCENIYNNLIHFGGMPFVPNPEVAQ